MCDLAQDEAIAEAVFRRSDTPAKRDNKEKNSLPAIRYVRTALCKALYQPINSFISEFSGTASGGTSFISDRNLGNSL